jgi:hypothetical protein
MDPVGIVGRATVGATLLLFHLPPAQVLQSLVGTLASSTVIILF